MEKMSGRCLKLCFATAKEARTFRKNWNKNNRGLVQLTNTYYCINCLAYHNTSMNKKQSRRKTRSHK